ncbi:MAG: hypothetical protein ACJAY8_000895 [Sphingobacteriales bacterium]
MEILEMKEVHEIPGAWNTPIFQSLLNLIDYEDVGSIPEEELKDMTAMALSDMESTEAAQVLLQLRFGESLSKGQRQNLAEELKDDRIWEEYADIRFHEDLFNISCMLNWAFPKEFPVPDIVKLRLKVVSGNSDSAKNVQNPSKSFIVRLLTDGMDDHNIILRLFDDQLASNSFPQAENIIWKFDQSGFVDESHSNEITLFTSWNWIDKIKGVKNYQSTAFADGQLH